MARPGSQQTIGTGERTNDGTSRFNRRSFLQASAATAAFGLAGCTSIGGGGGGGPFKVGVLMPFTGGGVSVIAEDFFQAIQVAVDDRGGTVLDRDIELIKGDSQFNPSTGKNVYDRLATRDEVDMVLGPVSSGVGEAIVENVNEHQILTNYVNAASRNAVGENCSRYIFKQSPTNEQQTIPIARWIANNLDGDVVILIADYTAGQQLNQFFRQYYGEAGGNVVETIYAPLDTQDFSSYFAQVRDSGADIMWSFFTGGSAIRMVTQAAEFGLDEHVTRTGLGYLCTQVELAAEGEAANGWITNLEFAETIERDEYTAFSEMMGSEYDISSPNLFHCRGFGATKAMFDAMEEAGTTNTDDVISQLEGYSYAAPFGDVTYRAGDHQAVLDYYIREVRNQQNEVIDTMDDVIQPDTCEAF